MLLRWFCCVALLLCGWVAIGATSAKSPGQGALSAAHGELPCAAHAAECSRLAPSPGPPAHAAEVGELQLSLPLVSQSPWGDPGDVGPSEQPGTSERHRVPSHRARPASRLGRLAEQQALCAPSSWGLRCPCCCQQVFASVSSVILTWVTACRLCLLPD